MNSNNSTSTFPYISKLDFGPLISFWKEYLDKDAPENHPLRDLLKDRKLIRELTGDVSEDSLEKHRQTIDMLLSAILPQALIDEDFVAVHVPFRDKALFSSSRYSMLLSSYEDSGLEMTFSAESDLGENCSVIAGLYILKNFYKPDLEVERPVMVTVLEKETGLEKVYKLEVNTRFADLEVNGELPGVSEADIEKLLENLNDHELWQKHLPPDKFIFKGFTISRLTDVTAQEMLSSIKYYLLRRDAVTCGTNFLTIQDKIRSLFRMPDLKLGIVFFDESYNIISNAGLSEWNSFLTSCDCTELSCTSVKGSIYDRVFQTQKSVIVEDLEAHPIKSKIEQRLLESGLRNIGIAPLISNGKLIGMLELATQTSGKLNPMNAAKLGKVMPMFTAAIERVLGDLQVEVRALIQKECTAIHPSVEWKFIEEGFKLIRNQSNYKNLEMPEIVFEKVYPLFGMNDIRNSSVFRNSSIQEDLIANLEAAQEVFTSLFAHKNMHIFNELKYRVEKELRHIENGLASGDESTILDFIKNDINNTLRFYQKAEPQTEKLIAAYFKKLDPALGVVYKKRRAFEESLIRINETISEYIDEAEKTAQDIYPHYFEKYKTDGVEYTMYVGESLNRNIPYNPLFLRNFRLWQLVLMTEVARRINDLQPELSHPLEITQLILVQNEPLDIRFRKDEKHFDVDGAYNIRYEIIKKRIDKAFIKDSSERLTQPGKISIVYSNEKEADEYVKYLEYLNSAGLLTGETEHLELEDVQGAHGLKALRVSVNLDKDTDKEVSDLIRDTISEVLN